MGRHLRKSKKGLFQRRGWSEITWKSGIKKRMRLSCRANKRWFLVVKIKFVYLNEFSKKFAQPIETNRDKYRMNYWRMLFKRIINWILFHVTNFKWFHLKRVIIGLDECKVWWKRLFRNQRYTCECLVVDIFGNNVQKSYD